MSVRKQEPELRKFLIIAFMKDYNDVGGIPPVFIETGCRVAIQNCNKNT